MNTGSFPGTGNTENEETDTPTWLDNYTQTRESTPDRLSRSPHIEHVTHTTSAPGGKNTPSEEQARHTLEAKLPPRAFSSLEDKPSMHTPEPHSDTPHRPVTKRPSRPRPATPTKPQPAQPTQPAQPATIKEDHTLNERHAGDERDTAKKNHDEVSHDRLSTEEGPKGKTWKVGYSQKYGAYLAYHRDAPSLKAKAPTPAEAVERIKSHYRNKGLLSPEGTLLPSHVNSAGNIPNEVKAEETISQETGVESVQGVPTRPVVRPAPIVSTTPAVSSNSTGATPGMGSADVRPEWMKALDEEEEGAYLPGEGAVTGGSGDEEGLSGALESSGGVVVTDSPAEALTGAPVASEGGAVGVEKPVGMEGDAEVGVASGSWLDDSEGYAAPEVVSSGEGAGGGFIEPTLVDGGGHLPEETKAVRKAKKAREASKTGRVNKKRWERKGFRLKDTDKELLGIASRYRYVTTRTAARYLDVSHDTARRRMRKLKEVSLFTSKQVGPHQTLWLPTPSGLELINSPYKAIEKHNLGLAHLNHETGILHLGVELETAHSNPLNEALTLQYKHPDLSNPTEEKIRGNNTVTVKQMRSSQYWWMKKYGSQEAVVDKIEEAKSIWQRNPHQQTPELHPDNAVMWILFDEKAHNPDLVVARDRNPDGSPASLAIELELTSKQPVEWERILRSFKNSWQYDKLYYLTPHESIAKKLKKINDNEVGIPEGKFIILRYMSTNGKPSGYQPFQI